MSLVVSLVVSLGGGAGLLALVASPVFAQNNDLVPAREQSDSQLSVWVNNASLDLFVEQLASLTGRDVSIEGDLQGEVSGSFNGSMVETLGEVSQQFPVLFDLDDKTLGAVPVAMSTRSTISMGDTVLDAPMQQAMLADLLPGNALEFDDEQVIVSGHPDFVERTVAEVNLAMAGPQQEESAVVASSANDGSETAASETAIDNGSEAAIEPSIGAAINQEDEVAEPRVNLEQVAGGDEEIIAETDATTSADRTIRWVTDIPGFDTF